MENQIGKIRLYAIRFVFFLTFIGLVNSAWQELIAPDEMLEPFYGIAISFWAALSIPAIIGIIYPVKMLPILLLQFSYKLTWLVFVGLPIWQSGADIAGAEDLIYANGIGVILDLLVIPWIFVFKKYFGKPVW